MKKFIFIYLLCIAANYTGNAQNVCIDSSFIRSFSLPNKSVYSSIRVPTADNGILMTVAEDFSISHSIAKISAAGHIEWARNFFNSGLNRSLLVTNLLQLKNGEYIVGGKIMYEDNSFPDKVILIKLNSTGNIIWQKQLDNNYGSSTQNVVNLRNLQEGLNGDIIVLTKDPNVLSSQDILTRLNSNGMVVWSNAYFGKAILIQASKNIMGADGFLHLWGVSFGNTGACFTYSEGLTYLKHSYSTGQLVSSKTFCIAPGKIPIGIQSLQNFYNEYGAVTKKLQNGNTLVFIDKSTVPNSLLINVFDSNYSFIKSVLYKIPASAIPDPPIPVFNFDVNPATGEVVANFYLRRTAHDYVYPFNFYLFLDKELNLQRQLFVQEPALDTVWGNTRFLQNGDLNFVGRGKQQLNPQYDQLNFSNTIVGNSTDAFCNAKDSIYGSLEPHGLIESGNFQYDSIKNNVYQSNDVSPFTMSASGIVETTTCVKYSICDSLKIQGSAVACSLTDTFIYTAYKNPQCLKNIQWQADTTFAEILQSKDSLRLRFKKTGSTTIYASLAGCVIKDSIVVNISLPKTHFAILSDSLICPGENKTLKASPGFAVYQWSTGSTADSAIAALPGWYYVTVIDSCANRFKDSIRLVKADTSLQFLQGYTICNNDTLRINIPSFIKSIYWQPQQGISRQGNVLRIYPSQTTGYSFNVIFNGDCATSKNINIYVNTCPETVFVPNSFTPNGDGLNDRFKPIISRPVTQYYFAVYNRYGQVVFKSENPLAGWEGNSKEALQQTGSFTWQLRYAFAGKPVKFLKGTVLLIK